MKKKTLKDIFKNYKITNIYFFTFIIALIIINIIYAINNVTPYGENSLLCVDFYHQYGPMLGELYDRLKGFNSLIYSFSMGMGLPFIRNYMNYLSSPLNLLILLFPRKYLLTSYSLIIGLKPVLASTTCVYYLTKKFKTKELYLVPISLLYGFSAYFSAYYWDLMWLDGMVLLPLITLGIENIVNIKKYRLYTFSLAIMLLSNYFIGYMICIYSVIYFLIYNLYKSSFKDGFRRWFINIFKNFIRYSFASLLAGCLVAILLIPLYKGIASISATGSDFPTSQYYAFELVDYLKAHLSGVSTTVFASDTITPPNVSCGILSVSLLLIYILNLDIKIKNKIFYFLLLGFFIVAFFNPTLDFILQAFHVPNDLPFRYSFLYSFVFTIISAYSLVNIKKLKYPIVFLAYLFMLVLLFSIRHDDWPNLTTNMIYINMILLSLYFVFYTGTYFLPGMKKVFFISLTLASCMDIVVSINYNWDPTQKKESFYKDYNQTKEILKYVEDYDNDSFYRIERMSMMTLNDPSWYGYFGMTSFSSMNYESMAKLQHNLGLPSNTINSYYYAQTTPIYDLMFNMKYIIGRSNDKTRYKELTVIDEAVNEFTYNVGLMFKVNDDVLEFDSSVANPLNIQNDFIKRATGVEDVLVPISIHHKDIIKDDSTYIATYFYENTNDNMYYYSNTPSINFIIIGSTLYYTNESYLNEPDISYSYVENYDEEKIINILSSAELVSITIGSNYNIDNYFNMYTINHEKFEEAYNILIKNKVNISSFKESKIVGNISLDEESLIYTSIPYDDGWTLYIDGKKEETIILADSLLGFKVNEGNHKIVLKYKIPGFILGLLISIISILILIIDYIYHKRIVKFLRKIILYKPKKKYTKST